LAVQSVKIKNALLLLCVEVRVGAWNVPTKGGPYFHGFLLLVFLHLKIQADGLLSCLAKNFVFSGFKRCAV